MNKVWFLLYLIFLKFQIVCSSIHYSLNSCISHASLLREILYYNNDRIVVFWIMHLQSHWMKSYLVYSLGEYNITSFLSFEIKIELCSKISNFIQIKRNNDWLSCVNSTSSPAAFPLESSQLQNPSNFRVVLSHRYA